MDYAGFNDLQKLSELLNPIKNENSDEEEDLDGETTKDGE